MRSQAVQEQECKQCKQGECKGVRVQGCKLCKGASSERVWVRVQAECKQHKGASSVRVWECMGGSSAL